MERIFLAGTTHGTKWRGDVIIPALQALRVRADAIINPHLPPGTPYTQEYARWEDEMKEDPGTIILIYLCPANITDPALSEEERHYRNQTVGPITTLEIGIHAFCEPWRTAVVLDKEGYTKGTRPRRIVNDIEVRLQRRYGIGQPPLFDSLLSAARWAAPHLPKLVSP